MKRPTMLRVTVLYAVVIASIIFPPFLLVSGPVALALLLARRAEKRSQQRYLASPEHQALLARADHLRVLQERIALAKALRP